MNDKLDFAKDEIEKTELLLSIIIPVYNAEMYLKECLDSILCQNANKKDYEIICINDGSTDSSQTILEEYQNQHSNVRIVEKENGGPSVARNTGLQLARGKWIWFIDSDDYIVNNCLNYLLEQAEINNPDFIVFNWHGVENYQKKVLDFSNIEISFAEGKKAVLDLVPQKSYANTVWSYFFRKQTIKRNNLMFDKTMKYSEDTKFIYDYKFYAYKGMLIDCGVYCYRQNPNSLMHVLNPEKHLFTMIKMAEAYDNYAQAHRNAGDKELENRFEVAKCRSIRNALFDHCIYIRDYQRAKDFLNEIKKKGWLPFKVKLGIKSNTFKGTLINLFNELLEVEWIYLFLCKMRSKKSKKEVLEMDSKEN